MKHHKLKFLILFMLWCALPLASNSFKQVISQSEALQYVKEEFNGQDVDYYVRTNGSNWEIFVDANPMQGWEHDCYVYSVPKLCSSDKPIITSEHRTLPPTGDFTPIEVKNRYGLNANVKPLVKKNENINESSEAAARTYAIILSGGISLYSNHERYWNDCSFIYQTLVNKYGVPKSHIYPIMSDGDDPAIDMRRTTGGFISQPLDLDNDGIADISLAAEKQNIQNVLNGLINDIREDDHLFFYVIDHGGSDDKVSKSYICLWNYDKLYDHELAAMLAPFTKEYVNVNVVLGQCYSGGFVDDLSAIGCVVSTAVTGSELSYACPDIPFDEFVYQWTCAVNGANHKGVPVDADTDDNDRVTMEEAFAYAKANDRWKQEHPQYKSNPISIGEDLAFNHLAPAIDLYIKDNPEDTGKEPNHTTDEYWKSPSIWVRNIEDGIEEHENPYYAPDHLAAKVYVKIHNRGKKDAPKGFQWLHLYWADASTAFTDAAWKGREMYNGELTGNHFTGEATPAIKAGGTGIVGFNWGLPRTEIKDKDNWHHYCFKTKILDTFYDETFVEGKTYFDERIHNDQAQKNVSIIYKDMLSKKTKVYIRNISDKIQEYSLELIPLTKEDNSIFNYAAVEMEMSPKVYEAWEKGGFEGENIIRDVSPNSTTRKLLLQTQNNKIRKIRLDKNEFDVVSLKFNFKNCVIPKDEYTLDLIQRDENGKILGGETFIVKTPKLTLDPGIIVIDKDSTKIKLNSTLDDGVDVTWMDEKGFTIGNTNTISVEPKEGNNKYSLLVHSVDGDIKYDSVDIEYHSGIKSVSSDGKHTTVELHLSPSNQDRLEVVSLIDGKIKETILLDDDQKLITFDTSDYTNGLYSVVYVRDEEVVDNKKFQVK